VANALFVQAPVENLAEELDGTASEVLVQFPWGSLLRGVAAGDAVVMRNLRRICLPPALLHVTLGLDLEKDSREWQRLGLPEISIGYVSTVLAARYLQAGLQIVEAKQILMGDVDELHTSWARRLRGSSSRSLMVITARATGQ
jgi:16S rRNA (adenine(1408)-N(1))-methyltransferase